MLRHLPRGWSARQVMVVHPSKVIVKSYQVTITVPVEEADD